LEKGRKGMASTVLIRMKIGTKLIDAKGVSMLYRRQVAARSYFAVALAALFPVAAMLMMNPVVQHMFHLIWLNLKIFVT
jgi:uncharacterized membrane-anchored protein